MTRRLSFLVLALVGLAITPALASDQALSIRVNCDTVGALPAAFEQVREVDEAVVYIEGVCRGKFKLDHDNLRIVGMFPGAGIAPPDEGSLYEPTVLITGGDVSLGNLTVWSTNNCAVEARGRTTSAGLFGVELPGGSDSCALFIHQGARVRLWNSTIQGHQSAVFAREGVELNIYRSVIQDNDYGVSVHSRSDSSIMESVIERSDGVGLSVGQRSSVYLSNSRLSDNVGNHVMVRDRSDVTVDSRTSIGSESDETAYSFALWDRATVYAFRSPEIFGDVRLYDDSSLTLRDFKLRGSIYAQTFSKLDLWRGTIFGETVCREKAQALCSQLSTLGTRGCDSPACGIALSDNAVGTPPRDIPEPTWTMHPAFEPERPRDEPPPAKPKTRIQRGGSLVHVTK